MRLVSGKKGVQSTTGRTDVSVLVITSDKKEHANITIATALNGRLHSKSTPVLARSTEQRGSDH